VFFTLKFYILHVVSGHALCVLIVIAFLRARL